MKEKKAEPVHQHDSCPHCEFIGHEEGCDVWTHRDGTYVTHITRWGSRDKYASIMEGSLHTIAYGKSNVNLFKGDGGAPYRALVKLVLNLDKEG
jgi:hypothetical protein